MDGRGQTLLLSALVVCVCLITLATFLTSIRTTEPAEYPWPGKDVLNNLVWAQDAGLKHMAGEIGQYPREHRRYLAYDYKNGADQLIEGISTSMLGHGLAYSFNYNSTLASQYLCQNNEPPLEDIDGVLVKQSGSTVCVYGCAYDVAITDGSMVYRTTRVITWP